MGGIKMEAIYKIIVLLTALLAGYLFGSIPTSVIIGKVFYHKDIRDFGSHNAGGTNAGRVFGKKVGLTVMIIDIIKTVIPVWSVYFITHYTIVGNFVLQPWVLYLTAFGALAGHCFPIFAGFRGGKAVSSFGGFVLATNWILAIIGLTVFFIVLKLKKHVSLSSICGSAIVTIFSIALWLPELSSFGMWPGMTSGVIYTLFLMVETFTLFSRHRENIERLLTHHERRITWMH